MGAGEENVRRIAKGLEDACGFGPKLFRTGVATFNEGGKRLCDPLVDRDTPPFESFSVDAR
jgi:hypothetical protein